MHPCRQRIPKRVKSIESAWPVVCPYLHGYDSALGRTNLLYLSHRSATSTLDSTSRRLRRYFLSWKSTTWKTSHLIPSHLSHSHIFYSQFEVNGSPVSTASPSSHSLHPSCSSTYYTLSTNSKRPNATPSSAVACADSHADQESPLFAQPHISSLQYPYLSSPQPHGNHNRISTPDPNPQTGPSSAHYRGTRTRIVPSLSHDSTMDSTPARLDSCCLEAITGVTGEYSHRRENAHKSRWHCILTFVELGAARWRPH